MTNVEKSGIFPHTEEFQIFHSTDVEKSKKNQISRNFKFLHMTDVKKSEILPVSVVKSILWQLTQFSRKPFCRDLHAFAWKQIEPNIV